jgi:AcrR family transcriptional regulator
MATETTRRRRSDGERSRRTILMTAARLATVDGLDGITIGRLADETGMSKSGLFAHFGSKEELQLATIGMAEEIFEEDVLRPALEVTGLRRVEVLCERFLSHVERGVFPGGCFFASAAAELDTRPGPVRERVALVVSGWLALLERLIGEARERGELSHSEEPAQLAFELDAFLLLANSQFLLSGGDPAPLGRARRAIERRLRAADAAV